MKKDIDIKNINRDYLVTVNAKTAAMKAPTGMRFFITDILTCNIFFKLEFDKPASDLTGFRVPKESAKDYELTLRIVKPNNETEEVIAELIDEGNDFFVADLPTDCTKYVGTYTCELFIDTMVTLGSGEETEERPERSTTDSFEYKVIESIFNTVDEVIESFPDYPLLDSLATKKFVLYTVENMDLYGYATRKYVNEVLIGGDINLSDYVTKKELSETLEDLINDGNINLDNYVTDQELADELAKIEIPEYDMDSYLSDYVTKDELEKALIDFSIGGEVNLTNYATKADLENKADVGHTHDEYVTNEALEANYVTKSQLPDIPDSLPANGGNANTVGGYGIYVCTQAQYDALGSSVENDNVLYFIKEDE